jgi:transposase
MQALYIVELEENEKNELKELLRGGSQKVRKVKRAQILLAADQGLTDEKVADFVDAGTSTVYRTRRKYVEGGLAHALTENQRPGGKRKLSNKDEALLFALACTDPPTGRAKWTMELLAGGLVQLTEHESLSKETVRRRLEENKLKPWRQTMWCIPKVDAEYVARMEDILDLYEEPPDPKRPVVNFDETPIQLIGETRVPIAAKKGKPRRIDYEYKRNGTANLFVTIDRHAGKRKVNVTDRRTKIDFALQMKELIDVDYPDADLVRVVLDNLNTHRAASLYEAFEPAEARRILRKLEFHFTPKHASWLNMVEIEIGVLSKQCLDRRIPDKKTLVREVAAWERQRNTDGATIRWMFTVDKARQKMGAAYPSKPL